MKIRTLLNNLPETVCFEGCKFQLEIAKVDGYFRICYVLHGVNKNSKHYRNWNEFHHWYNPVESKSLVTWLFMSGGIETEQEFRGAMICIKRKLRENNFINKV